jgi:hypothetical protein
VVAGVALLLVVGVAIAVAVGGSSDNGGGNGGRKEAASKKPTGKTTSTATGQTTSTTQSATTPGSEASVELRATADVWVCVIDAGGRHLVNGETLAADQSAGPFSSTDFEMTFGNGSVDMTVDGQPVKVPALAEPLGYRVSAGGASRLKPSDQPDCA